MNKIEELVERLCPEGVEFKKLWEVTVWDKKFNGLDKHMQKKVIIYPYVLANKFKELELEKGNVRFYIVLEPYFVIKNYNKLNQNKIRLNLFNEFQSDIF